METVFNSISWSGQDELCESTTNDSRQQSSYVVDVFGRKLDGKSVFVRITGFKPFFYVKRSSSLRPVSSRQSMVTLIETQSRCGFIRAGEDFTVTEVMRRDSWGFQGHPDKLSPFFLIESRSARIIRSIKDVVWERVARSSDLKIIYDFVSQPFLRMFHICDIDPTGWIYMSNLRNVRDARRRTNCDEEYELDFRRASPSICRPPPTSSLSSDLGGRIAPFRCASFDIECTSHDGLFPTACKKYEFMAHELVEMWGSEWKKMSNMYERMGAIQSFMMLALTSDDDSDFLPRYRIAPTDRGATDIDGYAGLRHQVGMLVDDIRSILESSVFRKIGTKPVTPEQAVQQILRLLSDAVQERRLPCPLGDEIIQIGTTFYNANGQDERKVVVVTGTCDSSEDVEIVECPDEQSLILRWAELMHDADVDVMVGYNTFGFDIAYIRDRLSSKNTEKFAQLISRRRLLYRGGGGDEEEGEEEQQHMNGAFRVTNLTSSAMGDNEFTWIDVPGRVCIDLMHIVKRDYKLDSYKLDDVAEHFTGERKHDVSPADIFRMYRGTSSDRLVIAKYCAQDCTLVSNLMVRLGVFSGSVGMSNVCKVPLQYIFIRGQGIKVFSLILHECCLSDAVFPWLPPPPSSPSQSASASASATGYEGAIVLEPQPGIYRDNAVAVMDYASLYPSSMIAENLSHDRLVIPGITPQPLDPSLETRTISVDASTSFVFVQGEPGILPRTLKKLLDARKATRKMLAVASTEDTKMVLDGLQLAYKITANSLYGQLGASTSPIRHMAIAASTTAVGRSMIVSARAYMESDHSARVIYGDSVAGYTPLLVRLPNRMVIIESVDGVVRRFGINSGAKWQTCVGRESKQSIELVDGLDTWTDEGWTKIHRVIRHVLAPHKRMMRVTTRHGIVDVTDDHSLIRADGTTTVSPTDLRAGEDDALLHAEMPCFTYRSSAAQPCIKAHEARVMGMFMGCGGSNTYGTRSGPINLWAIGHANKDILREYFDLCGSVYPGICFHMQSDGARFFAADNNKDAVGPTGPWDMEKLAYHYRRIMYQNTHSKCNAMKVPSRILQSSEDIRRAFWQGLIDSEGCADDAAVVTCIDRYAADQVTSATVFALASSLGLNPVIEHVQIHDRWNGVRIASTTNKPETTQDNNNEVVRDISEILYNGKYVYDLTTDNHKFSAGIGQIVVHNTDSIFCVFPDKGADVAATIDTASRAADAFTNMLRPPHVLEYEKTFWPFILITKKRYIGNVYGNTFDAEPKRQAMGIVLKRRDNAPIVKRVYGGLIDVLLSPDTKSAAAAESFLRSELREIVAGRIGIEAFVTSKRLRLEYKDPTRIAHNVLAKRMAQRDPGSRPRAGDRVPYVYIEVCKDSKRNAAMLQGDRIEHPKYILDNKLTVDFRHYITNQIMKPVCQLLSLSVEELSGFSSKHARSLLEGDGNTEKKRENIVKEILFDPALVPKNTTRITDFYCKKI